MTRWALVVIIGTVAGCVSSSPPPSRPWATLLVQADRMVIAGQYGEALDAYGEILAKYPDADEADHARSGREALAALLAARAQVARLAVEMKAQEADMKAQEAELARTREQIAAREHEVARAREQGAARDSDLARARQEIARLTAEADRLRADLETLKKIDIDLERRRK